MAIGEHGVLVADASIADLGEGPGHLGSLIARDEADRNRPGLAVELAVAVQVGLERAEADPAPAGGAERLPLVVVGRGATVGELPLTLEPPPMMHACSY